MPGNDRLIAYSGREAWAFAERLPSARPQPVFAAAAWVSAAWRHLPELGEPVVVVSWGRGSWWALPMARRESLGRTTLALAGAPLGDSHELTGPDRPAPLSVAERVVDWLARQPSVQLDALDGKGRLAGLVEAGALGSWSVKREPAPVIPVARAVISAAGQSRRWRRLARLGQLDLTVARHGELTRSAVGEFVRRRLRRWRTQGRLDQLPEVERSPGFPRFLEEAVEHLSRAGLARMWTLRLDGRPIAEDLHLGPADRPLLYMRSYEPEVSSHSPGRVLLEGTLLRLRVEGVPMLGTGRGEEPYKMALGAGCEYVVNASLDSA